jgi:hypothetical protein
METVGKVMASPLLAGIPISSRFAEKLGIAEEAPIEPVIQEEDKFQVVDNQIKDLETRVNQQLEELKQGWERLPGAAGKRDSDPQPSIVEKIIKKHPELVKSNPSMLEKYEIYLRNVKKMSEEEVDNIMMPLWSNYLNGEKASDPGKDSTYQKNMKRTTETDPLLTAVEKLAGMIEGMNKPKTVIRDKDGRITGVA